MFKVGSTGLSNGATGVDVDIDNGGIPANYISGYVYSSTGYSLISAWLVGFTGGDTAKFVFSGAASTGYSFNWVAMSSDPAVGITGPTGASVTGPTGATGAGVTGATGATGSNGVPAKPINRLPVATSLSDSDFVTVQSTSGGTPVTYRMSLSAFKTYINS